MALPLPPGLVPAEVAFLCEMEMVTIVPRQRLESIPLLSVSRKYNKNPHPAFPPYLTLNVYPALNPGSPSPRPRFPSRGPG